MSFNPIDINRRFTHFDVNVPISRYDKKRPISIILLNKVSNFKMSDKHLRIKVFLLSSKVGS